MMIGLMENAALKCAEQNSNPHLSTVGALCRCRTHRCNTDGAKVRAVAELVEIDQKKLLFKVEAYDEVENW